MFTESRMSLKPKQNFKLNQIFSVLGNILMFQHKKITATKGVPTCPIKVPSILRMSIPQSLKLFSKGKSDKDYTKCPACVPSATAQK